MVLQNIRIIDSDKEYVSDVKIVDGVIQKIGHNLEDAHMVDAAQMYLFPKLIDVGTNFSNGSIKALSRVVQKAQKSGIGTIINSSKTTPILNNETSLESLQLKSSFEEVCFKPLINAKEKDGLSDIAILINKGAVAIEIDSDYDLNLIARAFEYAKLKNVPIVCNANSKSLQGAGMVAEGRVSNKLGIAGVSTLCESVEVVKIAHMAQFYGVELLFLNLGTEEGIDQRGDCLVSSSIHHILKDSSACLGFNTKAKIFPPLRQMLLDRLDSIDIITSMHAKTTSSDKDLAFAEASYGIDTLEEFLPLCYSLVKTGHLDMVSLIQKICYNPAKLFGIDASIQEGKVFDGVIFDPCHSFTLNKQSSLYHGENLYGKVCVI
ncbi:MAG: amidohydrolase family protein [Campylobacterota bacterium]